MRVPRLSVCLFIAIAALFAAASFWLLHRGARERPSGPDAGGRSAPAEAGAELRETPPASPGAPAEASGDVPPVAAGSGAPPDAIGLPVSIEGKVSDASGAPVAGARVAAIERRALAAAIARDEKLLDRAPIEALRAFRRSMADFEKRLPSCRSAEDGAYALRGLSDGEHRVVVVHPDFIVHAEEEWIAVEAGARARHDVELAAGRAIAGVVRDARGLPVAGVRVEALRTETSRLKGFGRIFQDFIEATEGAALLRPGPTATDALGAFRSTSLAPDVYDLRFIKDGWAWGQARDVAAGAEDVAVTLEPALRVAGAVVSPAGEPVAGAAVLLREPERDLQDPGVPLALAFLDVDAFGERERRTASGEDGRFALEAFAKGSYELVVRAPGFPEQRRTLAIESGPLDLGEIALAAGGAIAGAVYSPDGQPLEGADVWTPPPGAPGQEREARRFAVLEAGPESSLASARTDARGEFRLEGLGGERHDVAVLAGGYPGVLLPRVALGGRGVSVRLERGVAVRGAVVDAEGGAPIAGARVSVEGAPASERTVGEDGRFELRGLRLGGGTSYGGSLVVRAAREGFRETRATIAFPDPAFAPSAEATLELRRPSPEESEAAVEGVVLDAAGEPIAGARVWTEVPGWPRALRRMEPPGSAPKEVRTGASGAFVVRAPQIGGGDFEVLASFPGLATSRAGPFPQHPGDGGWPPVEIRLGEGAAIEGRVTGLDGAPVPGARVRIWRDAQVPEEATLFMRLLPQAVGETTYCASDGSFRLRRIEPGSYRVEARAQGYAARTAGPLEIEDGSAPARVDIVLDAGGALEGRIVDVEGQPLAGIEVVVFPIARGSGLFADEEDELVQTGAVGAAAALTGSAGSYRIEHLAAGDYCVLARARGFEAAWAAAPVPGQPLPDLVLARHARIFGSVRDQATGAPLRRFALRLERRDAGGDYHEHHRRARDVADAEGRFACDGLRAGEWRLRISAEDHRPWQAALSLEPDEECEVEVALSPGRRIAGSVLRPDGSPIAGAAVTVRRDGEGRDLAALQSGENGGFAFGGLEEGRYQLQAAHPEHYAEAAEAVAKVEVAAGMDAAVQLVLRPAGRILGRIRGLVFSPPGADAYIVVFAPLGSPPPGPPFFNWTDERGTVGMDSVRPGRYRLELTHRRRTSDQGREWTVVPPEGHPLGEIEVRAGELASFELEGP
jgi:protocatechuate 3,4-dioxygenase beta subunit